MKLSTNGGANAESTPCQPKSQSRRATTPSAVVQTPCSIKKQLNMASKAAPAALFVLLNLLSLAFATYPPTPYGTCPDTLKLDVCVTVFNNWLSVTDADKQKCCDLLTGVAALDVNACICAAIDISSLAGIIPININLLFNQCKWTKPADFHCKL
ncbi:hypothetical protein J5N97_029604 [Dioscorea zingiberensis]|uniref:Hydrophobic seed protein domain-containing protein n=1 Tax=Dioscorea zingiberensis TaxID=325984 RepID=A0A9D5BW15_9LILI|nr:hypothetical protein J5N97_029604 [Dioscorea zingiberensis]